MLSETVQDILTTLRDLEQQETLLVEANFVERVYALDMLSFRVLEHIENVQYVHGYHAYLGRLYHRAERLWQRLENVNAQLFRLEKQLTAATSAAQSAAPPLEPTHRVRVLILIEAE